MDKASGKLESRPSLDALLDEARPGDTVVVWRLDRLGRSLRHLIEVVGDLERRGVSFSSLTESIDTSRTRRKEAQVQQDLRRPGSTCVQQPGRPA